MNENYMTAWKNSSGRPSVQLIQQWISVMSTTLFSAWMPLPIHIKQCDYSICGCVHQKPVKDMDLVKQCLTKVWSCQQQTILHKTNNEQKRAFFLEKRQFKSWCNVRCSTFSVNTLSGLSDTVSLMYFGYDCQWNKTAELLQRRPRDAPNVWVHWKVLRVLTTHPTTFPEICNGLLFGWTLWIYLPIFKFVALPVPKIIGGTQKIWAVPGYAHAPFSPKILKGFCSDRSCEYTCQIWSS